MDGFVCWHDTQNGEVLGKEKGQWSGSSNEKQGWYLLHLLAQSCKRNYKNNSTTIINFVILHCPHSFLSWHTVPLWLFTFACPLPGPPFSWTDRVHPRTFFRPVLICNLHAGALLAILKQQMLHSRALVLSTSLLCSAIIFWHTIYFTGLSPPTFKF